MMSFLVPMITDLVSNVITQQKEPELLGEVVAFRLGAGKIQMSLSILRGQKVRKGSRHRRELKGQRHQPAGKLSGLSWNNLSKKISKDGVGL